MAKKYISQGQLSIASELLDFVNNELLPGTNVTKENFWSGLDKSVHELAPKNRKLLDLERIYKKKLIFGTEIKKEKKLILKNIQIF